MNYYNGLKLTDKFEFGQFKGIEVGLIYLIKPDYIEWILKNTNKYLLDIDDAMAMKVIQIWDLQSSITLSQAGLNEEVLGDQYYNRFSFNDLKYSGFLDFKFDDETLNKNQIKIEQNYESKEYCSFSYPNDYIIHLVTNIHEIPDFNFELKCIGIENTEKGYEYLIFLFDNSRNDLKMFKNIKELKIASFFYQEWNISIPEFEKKANNDLLLNAHFKDGRIFIDS